MFKREIDLERELSSIRLENIPSVDIGISVQVLSQLSCGGVIKNIGRLLKYIFFMYTNIVHSESRKRHIFFFSREYKNRIDYKDFFYKIGMSIKDSVLLEQSRGKFKIDINSIKLLLKWRKQLSLKRLSRQRKYWILAELVAAWSAIREIEQLINNDDIVSISVLCDFHFIDNVVVQYFNSKNISTVTYEHGLFSRNNPIPFTASQSKYFLIYGDFIEAEAKKSSYNSGSLIKVGMPQLFSRKVCGTLFFSSESFKTIGIILSGPPYISRDIRMCKLIESYAKKKKLKVFVKFHPGHYLEEYKEFSFKNGNFDKIFFDEISSKEFIEKVDLVVCGGSTVILELLIMMKPFLIFRPTDMELEYLGTEFLSFSSVREFEDKLFRLNSNTLEVEAKMKKLREYFSLTDNVNQRYQSFYKCLSPAQPV